MIYSLFLNKFHKKTPLIVVFTLVGAAILAITSVDSSLDTNISIRIIDFKNGYCGGTINNSGNITYWDSINILSFTLGIANFDSEPHTLEQVNITMVGKSSADYSTFTVLESVSEEEDLPVTLLKRQYWTGNFTCPPCTDHISVKLRIDAAILDFGVINTGLGGFQPSMLTTWTNASYYTNTSTTRWPVIVISPFLIGVVLFRKDKRKLN